MRDNSDTISDRELLSHRPTRNIVSASQPYHFLSEQERSADGQLIDVATLFLTNRECAFRCLMCDLWKNTLSSSVQPGDIPRQIALALAELPAAQHIKLYNSGNFFDSHSIPVCDYPAISSLVKGFRYVTVENHPTLCGDLCRQFRDLIAPATLEVALGLETCHPDILRRLNKRMTLQDFDTALDFLHGMEIHTRAFILLKPPFQQEQEAIEWSVRSVDYAFKRGVDCCVVIPTRAGNGIMDHLAQNDQFSPPSGHSLELVLEQALTCHARRVFVDLWNAQQFFACPSCRDQRIARLHAMNLSQSVLPRVLCESCS